MFRPMRNNIINSGLKASNTRIAWRPTWVWAWWAHHGQWRCSSCAQQVVAALDRRHRHRLAQRQFTASPAAIEWHATATYLFLHQSCLFMSCEL